MSQRAQLLIMVVAFFGLLWAGVVLAANRNGIVKLLGWSAIAAWVYVAVASPVGQALWSTLGSWAQQATAWLTSVGRKNYAG
jgi:hypothetical protein